MITLLPDLRTCMAALATIGGFPEEDRLVGEMLGSLELDRWQPWMHKWATKRARDGRESLRAAGIETGKVAALGAIKKVERHGKESFKVTFKNLGDEFATVRDMVSEGIPGRSYNAKGGFWIVPADSVAVPALKELAATHGFNMGPGVTRRMHRVVERAQGLLALSRSVTAPEGYRLGRAGHPNVDGQALWGHQVAGIRALQEAGWCGIIGDDMGTGKTAMGYRAAVKAGVFRRNKDGRQGMLVIAPFSVKPGWLKNAMRWNPELKVVVTQGGDLQNVDADVVVTNYDQYRFDGDEPNDFMKQVILRNFKMVVFDEGHYLADERTIRVRAIRHLLERNPIPLRLGMTGSPVLNAVEDFVVLLELTGMMRFFGGVTNFRKTYCHKDADLIELNTRLREHGFICRLKRHHALSPDRHLLKLRQVPTQILPEEVRLADDPRAIERRLNAAGYVFLEGALKLPEDRAPEVVPLPLTNRGEYNRAHHQFKEWLREKMKEEGGDMTKWSRIVRNEGFGKTTYLRKLTMQGKLAPAGDWLTDVLATGEKVLIYVWHREAGDYFLERFPGSAVIRGGQSNKQRQAEIARFIDDPECRLMVSQIKAGGVGIDGLQEVCSTVAFLELAWNPTTHSQAEDRLDRGGQLKEVLRYYLLAEESIDLPVAQVIDEKLPVVRAATHGGGARPEEMLTTVFEEVLAA